MTLKCGHSAKCWNTMPILARIFARSASLILIRVLSCTPIRWPDTCTLPASGTSSQLMQRNSVDLPQPDGPSRQTVSPCATFSDTSCKTWLAPNDFDTPTILNTFFVD